MIRASFFSHRYDPAVVAERSLSSLAIGEWTAAPRSYPSTPKRYSPQWAPVTFEPRSRSGANAITSFAVVVDSDKGATRAQLENALADFACEVHSTSSHTEEAPRYRGVVFVTRTMVAKTEHPRAFRWLAALLERHGIEIDLAGKSAATAWAVPMARPGYEHFSIRGALLDVDQALEEMPEERPLLAPVADITSPSAYARAVLRRCVAAVETCGPGVRNATLNREAFAVARFVASGELSADEFTGAMLAAASAARIPMSEARATLRSCLRGRKTA